jgi:hypothetical protein
MGGVALIAVLLMPDTRHRGYLTADEGRHLEPERIRGQSPNSFSRT